MYTCQHAQGYLQTDIQVCQHTRQTYKYVNTTDRHTSMSTHQGLPTGVHMAVKPRAAYVQSVCVHVLRAASRGARHSVLTHARHSVLTRAHHSVLTHAHHSVLTHAHHSALTHPALQASRALWVALPPTDPLQWKGGVLAASVDILPLMGIDQGCGFADLWIPWLGGWPLCDH